MTTSEAIDQLPTLPEVHLRALEACRRHDSFRRICDIVHQDTALSGRVLVLANAASYHQAEVASNLDQALLRLGTDRLQNLILTAALQQLLFELGEGHWQQLHGFWQDSLGVALTARALARLTRFPAPDKAFLCGMLHNCGKLLLLTHSLSHPHRPVDEPYQELSARLAAHWGLEPAICDALAHHCDELTGPNNADHLQRLTTIAVQLVTRQGHGLNLANHVFGLEEELTAEILRRIHLETSDLAEEMGISAASRYDGGESTRKLTVATVRELLSRDQPATTAPDTAPAEQIRRQIHEINNPLTVVRQYLFRLKERLADSNRSDIDIIEEELGRASELLAELGRSGHAANPDNNSQLPATVNSEVRALTELLREGLFRENRAGCTLDLCAEDTSTTVPPSQLRQVVLNLLRNASESRPDGGVNIEVRSSAPIWQQDQRWVELTISDDGPGLPDTVRDRLFEPVTSGKGEGHSGLGLSIVKQLMDDMDAIISCQSSHRGTRFRLLFPANT